MPVNLDALLRYHTIDSCLQNKYKEWTWEKLSEACFNSMDEIKYRSEKNRISKRTIENDIKIMRANTLGYNAPIKCKKSIYSYTDAGYSIKNATLNSRDIESISLAGKVLGSYKGFDFFKDLDSIFEKFESKLQIKLKNKIGKIVEFDQIPDSGGTAFLNPFIQHILNKEVVEVSYKRFDQETAKLHIIHPYLLKEFKNRWYVLGLNNKLNLITTYALDRINSINVNKNIDYTKNTTFESEVYFENTIGITYTGKPASEIIVKIKSGIASYFLSQPLHNNQEIVESNSDFTILKFRLVINPELKALLMSYSENLTVLEPQELRETIISAIKLAGENYV